MSGYYSSTIVYDERATRLVECRTALARTVEDSEATGLAIAQLLGEVSSASMRSPELRGQSVGLMRRLDQLGKHVADTSNSVSRSTLPSSYAATTLPSLDAFISSCDSASRRMSEIRDEVIALATRQAGIDGTDARLVTSRTALFGASRSLQASRRVLERWRPDLFDRMNDEISELQTRLAAVQKQADVEAGTATDQELASIESACDAIIEKVDGAAREAEDTRLRAERRAYLADALRDSCTKLGFREIEEMRHESAGDPTSPLVLRFDTLNRGVVEFTLGLDLQITTDSDIDPKYCASEFDRLTQSLEAAYGVAATFTRLQHEEPRDRHSGGARQAPNIREMRAGE
jgi:chromosome segregation ATPase